MSALAQIPILLGLGAGAALSWLAIAVLLTLFVALLAASAAGGLPTRGPPPADPQSCITTLAGSIEQVRAGLPAGDHRSWSEHGPGPGRGVSA